MQKGHFGNGSREILALAHVVVVSSDNFAGNNGLKKKILISSAKPKGGRVRVKYKRSKSNPGLACAGGLIRDEMDLGVLVNAIKASSSSLVCEPLFTELNLMPGKDWEVRVSHNYRDIGNRSADWLASAGFSTCIGVALPRFCRL
ncbi:hypothetical protein OIU84_020781 [Salix udensis]|uniref:RNase H type-1 domain-containing protein n=1 Tax=Salix udensis TaxID=889485 RepID=A0AAD6KT27_9ROSI|nr:hypothetical protein OIU84_020781 [Salix udensis]